MVSSSQKESSHKVEECPGRATIHGPSSLKDEKSMESFSKTSHELPKSSHTVEECHGRGTLHRQSIWSRHSPRLSLKGEKYMDSTLKSSRGLASQRLYGRGERSGHSRSGQSKNIINNSKAQHALLRTADLLFITKNRSGTKRSICSPRIMLATLAMFLAVAKGAVTLPKYDNIEAKIILKDIAAKCTNPHPHIPRCFRVEANISSYFYGGWNHKKADAAIVPGSASVVNGFPKSISLGIPKQPFRIYKVGSVDIPIMFLEQSQAWWILMAFEDLVLNDNNVLVPTRKLAWYSTKTTDFYVYTKAEPQPTQCQRTTKSWREFQEITKMIGLIKARKNAAKTGKKSHGSYGRSTKPSQSHGSSQQKTTQSDVCAGNSINKNYQYFKEINYSDIKDVVWIVEPKSKTAVQHHCGNNKLPDFKDNLWWYHLVPKSRESIAYFAELCDDQPGFEMGKHRHAPATPWDLEDKRGKQKKWPRDFTIKIIEKQD